MHYIFFQLSYFHPSGFFGLVKTTYVNQRVELFTGKDHDDFVLVDVGIGYRLPKRYGIINLGVKNLFDTRFRFEEFNILRERQGTPPRFQPERSVFAQITLAY